MINDSWIARFFFMVLGVRKAGVIILLWAPAFLSYAQSSKKIICNIDTTISNNSYYNEKFEAKSFLQSSLAQEKINALETDRERVEILFFSYLNNERKRKGKRLLNFSSDLYSIANAYLKSCSSGNYKNNQENTARVNKPIPKAADTLNYRKGILKAYLFYLPVYEIPFYSSFYYDSHEAEGQLNLHKGNKPKYKAPENGEEYINNDPLLEPLTYYELSKFFYKKYLSKHSKYMLHKNMSDFACAVEMDKKTLFTGKIPSVKCVLLISARRLELIKSE